MSTISEKLTQLNTIKGDIKTAINNKGGEVGDDFSTYATAINNLSTGSGGSGETYENPEFYELRTSNGTNYDNLFRGYNGPDIDVSQWDTSKVTSAQYCFYSCNKSMDISNWDLSSLTDAYYMFNSFTNGNKYIDLSVLDFSNVTKADSMFGYSNTDYLDVRNINLTSITSYSNLFQNNYGTELDLSNWDISRVTNLYYLCGFSSFKKINLTGWNTINVKNMDSVFYYMSSLETLLIPDWDMTNATSISSFLYSTPKLKYIDLSRSNGLTIKKIASFLPTKTATAYGEILVPANTSQDAIDAFTAKYWKPIGPKFDLNSTEVALELDEIKPGKTTKICNGNSDPWYGDDRLETIEFTSSDESIATINGREIRGVAEGTVTITCRRREDNVVISTAPVTLTVSETDSKPNLIKVRVINDGSGYTHIIRVNDKELKSSNITKDPITGIYSYDPGEQITQISFVGGCISEIIKANYKEMNLTTMKSMFVSYQSDVLDISDINMSNVKSMNYTFRSAKMKTIIGEIDMSNVEFKNYNISEMFDYCSNLETVYIKNIFKNTNPSNIYEVITFDLSYTKIKDECLIYIINELPDLYSKGYSSYNNVSIKLPPINTLTQEQVQPAIDKGWTVANVNY